VGYLSEVWRSKVLVRLPGSGYSYGFESRPGSLRDSSLNNSDEENEEFLHIIVPDPHQFKHTKPPQKNTKKRSKDRERKRDKIQTCMIRAGPSHLQCEVCVGV
jgi:hypothetical protein